MLSDVKDGSEKNRKDDDAWKKAKADQDTKIMQAIERLVADREAEKKRVEEEKKKPQPSESTKKR